MLRRQHRLGEWVRATASERRGLLVARRSRLSRTYTCSMSFGLARGRTLDTAPGVVAVKREELPPVPDRIADDPSAGWIDPRSWFPSPDAPLELEIGCGKGTFLLQHGSASPRINLLGIEVAREFFEYTADRVRRAGLRHVRVLNADAAEFLRWSCASAVFSVVHIYFPDPWPKRRHHRRRIIRDDVLAQLARVLVPGGEIRLVTDHEEYWAWIEDHLARWCGETADESIGESKPFIRGAFTRAIGASDDELVGTNFERKYRREGRPFHAVVLRRQERAVKPVRPAY